MHGDLASPHTQTNKYIRTYIHIYTHKHIDNTNVYKVLILIMLQSGTCNCLWKAKKQINNNVLLFKKKQTKKTASIHNPPLRECHKTTH